jgi:hypothetical protein
VQSLRDPGICGTGDYILLSQNSDSPNLQRQAPASISPKNSVVEVCLQALGCLFVSSYDSQKSGGRIRTRLHTGIKDAEVEVKLRPTVSRPVRLGVRHPSGTRDQFFFLLEIFLIKDGISSE